MSQSPLSSTTTCHYINEDNPQFAEVVDIVNINDIPEEQPIEEYNFSVITNIYPTSITNALNTILITLYMQRGYEDYLRMLQ